MRRDQRGDEAREKMGRIRQLTDEIDAISASAERIREVSLVVSDTEDAIRLTILARAILNSLPEIQAKQRKLLHEQKQNLLELMKQ